MAEAKVRNTVAVFQKEESVVQRIVREEILRY